MARGKGKKDKGKNGGQDKDWETPTSVQLCSGRVNTSGTGNVKQYR